MMIHRHNAETDILVKKLEIKSSRIVSSMCVNVFLIFIYL